MLGSMQVPRTGDAAVTGGSADLVSAPFPLHHSLTVSEELSQSLAPQPLARSATLVLPELWRSKTFLSPVYPFPKSCLTLLQLLFPHRIPASPAISRCLTGSWTRRGRTTSIICEHWAGVGGEGGAGAAQPTLPGRTTQLGTGPCAFPRPCHGAGGGQSAR